MSQMRRFMSFRDFDWTLFGLVLALCTISVLEIYSATLHTKYVGFHTKQIYWISAGVIAMFVLSKIDYHKLIDLVPWAYGFFLFALMAVLMPGIGHKALGARRWIKLGPLHVSAVGVDEAGDDPGGGAVLRQSWRAESDLERDLQGIRAGGSSDAAGPEAARSGDVADVCPGSGHRDCFWAGST